MGIEYDQDLLDEQAERIQALEAEIERLRSVLERCRTVLGNMALENAPHPNMGFVFVNRWPISHEPLRADARGLLPVIDAALGDEQKVDRK